MSEEEQVHDIGIEGAPQPKASETTGHETLRVRGDLERFFDRTHVEKGERAAAEAALGEAERMAREQGDRSMHVADTSRETVNGALSRIGGDLSEGKDAGAALDQVKAEIVRLKAEERAALVALRNELPPPPTAADDEPEPSASPEHAAQSPTDAWSADERRDVAAYLDSIDATDKAHAAYMKGVRAMKKADKNAPDWSVKAGEVNELERAWKEAKAASRAKEDKLGAIAGELTGLDVGRKAGRDALRKRMEATPVVADAEAETEARLQPAEREPRPTKTAQEAVDQLRKMALALEERAARNGRATELYDQAHAVASRIEDWKNGGNADVRSLAAQVREVIDTARVLAGEDARNDPDGRVTNANQILEGAVSELESADSNGPEQIVSHQLTTMSSHESHAPTEQAGHENEISKETQDARAAMTDLVEVLSQRERDGYNPIVPSLDEIFTTFPEANPSKVANAVDAYRALFYAMAKTDPYAKHGYMREEAGSLEQLAYAFDNAAKLRAAVPKSEQPGVVKVIREIAMSMGLPDASKLPDEKILKWAQDIESGVQMGLRERIQRLG